MANTNPLTTLDIKSLLSFKHLSPKSLGNNPVMALNRVGINDISSISAGSIASVGEMSVLGNTFRGLMVKRIKGRYDSAVNIPLLADPASLKNKALQIGIRLTQEAVAESQRGLHALNITNNSTVSVQPIASTLTEASSAYYEIVLSVSSANSMTLTAFVNKQAIVTTKKTMSPNSPIVLQFMSAYFAPTTDDGFTYLLDDIYIAELDYNEDGTVTPQLLGDLSIEPFTVASYAGDEHTNTQGVDIVTALNNFNPDEDMGVLAIKPTKQAASMTFNTPNVTGKKVLGACLNIVYKDSIAPNGTLNYQITEGTTQLPAEDITDRSGEVAGFTTYRKILTVPANGGDWNADNLKFKLDIINKKRE